MGCGSSSSSTLVHDSNSNPDASLVTRDVGLGPVDSCDFDSVAPFRNSLASCTNTNPLREIPEQNGEPRSFSDTFGRFVNESGSLSLSSTIHNHTNQQQQLNHAQPHSTVESDLQQEGSGTSSRPHQLATFDPPTSVARPRRGENGSPITSPSSPKPLNRSRRSSPSQRTPPRSPRTSRTATIIRGRGSSTGPDGRPPIGLPLPPVDRLTSDNPVHLRSLLNDWGGSRYNYSIDSNRPIASSSSPQEQQQEIAHHHHH